MTAIGTPNWFAIASAFFFLSGIGILARSALVSLGRDTDNQPMKLSANQRAVDISFGVPMLILGALFNAVSSFAILHANAVSTTIMLGLAFTLLMYLMCEDLLADRLSQAAAPKAKPKLALIAPAATAQTEIREATSEIRLVEAASQN